LAKERFASTAIEAIPTDPVVAAHEVGAVDRTAPAPTSKPRKTRGPQTGANDSSVCAAIRLLHEFDGVEAWSTDDIESEAKRLLPELKPFFVTARRISTLTKDAIPVSLILAGLYRISAVNDTDIGQRWVSDFTNFLLSIQRLPLKALACHQLMVYYNLEVRSVTRGEKRLTSWRLPELVALFKSWRLFGEQGCTDALEPITPEDMQQPVYQKTTE